MLPVYHDAGKGHARPIRSVGLLSKCKGWIRSIFESSESRNIFLFLLVNLTFAFVELTYGLISNSLGLISDSFHMFFDCTALVGGLVASLIARKNPNERYPYGYGRAEVLGGFVNGLFLVFIAFFIFKEATERFLDPPTVHTHRLLPVAVMGLVVNLIGIFALGHGHSHGGGGGDHGHSHGAPAPKASSCSGGHDHHGHSHAHDHHGHDHHGHDHHGGSCSSESGKKQRNFIMDGVMLHILADCLGSVGVITSSILIHEFGWMISDAVCSLFISVMIFISTIPLIKGSLEILMQRTPVALEPKLYDCYRRVNNIQGVISYREPHFWSLGANEFVGSMVVVIAQDANDTHVQKSVHAIFRDAGVGKMVVQTDRF